jgi:RNA polymerase sigma factor (sigma-70 family)
LKKSYQDIHKETIELSKSGNVKAQYQLYSLYSKAMFNICMRMLIVKEEAEDTLQEAFTEVFDKLESYRFESSFGAWVKRIVINKCINKLNKKNPEVVYTDKINVSPDETQADFEETELKVKEVHKAIEKLPQGYRVIFCLYLLEGYDHGEISEILGISESTSKTQFMKAKRKVKELIIKGS